jgi:hypothetical protein
MSYRSILWIAALLATTVPSCISSSGDPEVSTADEALGLATRECRGPHDVLLGQCGADDGLFDPCTPAFTTACTDAGGSLDTTAAFVIQCTDDSKLFHDCDPTFKKECKELGGDFDCTNPDCTVGTCTLPD